jgi:hypothetical protein
MVAVLGRKTLCRAFQAAEHSLAFLRLQVAQEGLQRHVGERHGHILGREAGGSVGANTFARATRSNSCGVGRPWRARSGATWTMRR